MEMTWYNFPSPIGLCRAFCTLEGQLAALSFGERWHPEQEARLIRRGADRWLEPQAEPPAVALRARAQLEEYFSGRRRTFDLPLLPLGTDFERRIWAALARIPYGELVTYGELGRLAGAGCPRSVGTAVGHNPLPVVLPCHRVVRGDGRLGSFSCGEGPATKSELLQLEGAPLPARP